MDNKWFRLFFVAMVSGELFAQNVCHSLGQDPVSFQFEGLVYVDADQVIVSEKGIFVLLEDECCMLTKVLVSQINCDEKGLYVLAEQVLSFFQEKYCNKHDRICPLCFGCGEPGCKRRCECDY